MDENVPRAFDIGSEKDRWEQAAGRSLEIAFGGGFTFRHVGSDTSTLDGYMVLDGVDKVACEITRASREEELAFQAALNQRASGPYVELSPGSGSWIAELSIDTRLREQTTQQFQDLVGLMNLEGLTEFAREWYPQKIELQAACAQLGVQAIHLFDRQEDFVFRHREIDTHNTFLDSSSELVAVELQAQLDTDWLQEKASRLVERANDLPAHLVLIVGDRFSNSVRMRLWGVLSRVEVPAAPLNLPEGVSTVWLVAIGRWSMSYSRTDGWRLHDTREVRAFHTN